MPRLSSQVSAALEEHFGRMFLLPRASWDLVGGVPIRSTYTDSLRLGTWGRVIHRAIQP
jgi:hypothetical protein